MLVGTTIKFQVLFIWLFIINLIQNNQQKFALIKIKDCKRKLFFFCTERFNMRRSNWNVLGVKSRVNSILDNEQKDGAIFKYIK